MVYQLRFNMTKNYYPVAQEIHVLFRIYSDFIDFLSLLYMYFQLYEKGLKALNFHPSKIENFRKLTSGFGRDLSYTSSVPFYC